MKTKDIKKPLIVLVIILISVAIIVASAVFIVAPSLFIGGFFNSPINENSIETEFSRNYKLMITVVDYLKLAGDADVYINSSFGKGVISISGTEMKIGIDEVEDAIHKLQNRGFSVISKEGKTIVFQRWSNLDNGRGVAYSIDGLEPKLQFLTKVEPLTETNWYYYEEN